MQRGQGLRIPMVDLIGYVILFVISIEMGLVNTDLQLSGTISLCFLILVLFLFMLFLFCFNYELSIFIVILFFILIAFLTYLDTNSKDFIYMLVLAIVVQKLSYEKTFKTIFLIRVVMLIFIIGLSLFGVLNIYQTLVNKQNSYSVTGYGLGFTHPNRLAYTVLYILSIFIAMKNKKLTASNSVFLLVLSILTYFITQSRTIIFITVVFFFLLTFYNLKITQKYFVRLVKLFSVISIPLCVFISIGIPTILITGGGKIKTCAVWIDTLFSGRFTHIRRAFLNYPITLFGGQNDFSTLENLYGYSTIDNSYIRLLYGFGIVGFSLFIIFSTIAIYRLIKRDEYIYLLLIIVTAFLGVAENILTTSAVSIISIFWSELLRGVKSKEVIKLENRVSVHNPTY